MYLEFIYLILDYRKTVSTRVFLYEWLIPFIIGVGVFLLLFFGKSTDATETFKDNSLNLLGILVGFSITIITIITTGSSKNLDEIKKIFTDVTIGGQKISLYRMLLVNFTYSIVAEAFLIIVFLLMPIITDNFQMPILLKKIVFSILVMSVIHILLVTIRNLTDFYLIITKPEKK